MTHPAARSALFPEPTVVPSFGHRARAVCSDLVAHKPLRLLRPVMSLGFGQLCTWDLISDCPVTLVHPLTRLVSAGLAGNHHPFPSAPPSPSRAHCFPASPGCRWIPQAPIGSPPPPTVTSPVGSCPFWPLCPRHPAPHHVSSSPSPDYPHPGSQPKFSGAPVLGRCGAVGVAADSFLCRLQGQVGAFLGAGAMQAALSGLAMWLWFQAHRPGTLLCVPLSMGQDHWGQVALGSIRCAWLSASEQAGLQACLLPGLLLNWTTQKSLSLQHPLHSRVQGMAPVPARVPRDWRPFLL